MQSDDLLYLEPVVGMLRFHVAHKPLDMVRVRI